MAKTHCKHGHEFTPENTRYDPSRPTWRICRACSKAQQDDWYAKSRNIRRAYNAFSKYGLTLEEYEAMVALPCYLCGSTDRIVLDHDHDTGEVRGPLCSNCNFAIGLLQDNPDLLRKAADYIERNRDLHYTAEV